MRSRSPRGPRARHSSALLALVPLVFGLAFTPQAQAQWKWRDASGRVTASDLPPPRDIPEKDILQRPNVPVRPATPAPSVAASAAASAVAVRAAAPASARAPADKELEARRKAAEQQAQAKAKADEQRNAAIRADNCARARSHLATVESGQRMARINDKGEREILDDKTRAEEARRARETIASECR